MRPYFPKWTRVTVAEVETAARKVAWDELFVLAALFAEPVVSFLVPTSNTALEIENTIQPRKEQILEMLVGQGGTPGVGGLAWPTAQQIAGEPGPRPAVDLWAGRAGGNTGDDTDGTY
jgi:hypothetical protein